MSAGVEYEWGTVWVDYHGLSAGTPPSHDSPGDKPEFEITTVYLSGGGDAHVTVGVEFIDSYPGLREAIEADMYRHWEGIAEGEDEP